MNARREPLQTIPYTLKFEAPLLISGASGQPGSYDRVTVLDSGLPYVPASSIRGRVKDTLRRFLLDNREVWEAFRLCEGQEVPVGYGGDTLSYCASDVPCALCRIFGAPGGRQRGYDFSGAYYSTEDADYVREAFAGSDISTASLERRARNKREDKLRRAREDHLFVDGVANLFTDLHGMVWEKATHRAFKAEMHALDHRLVLLSLRLTTDLGACRRRGYGRCEFVPDDATSWQTQIEAFCATWDRQRTGDGA